MRSTGLSRYDCAGAHEEALTIALLLRRKLETPGATAALVTPDRELARRVAAELRRWGIEIDDSAGLAAEPAPRPGVFLRLVLDLAASGLAPVPLLAALKHPLAAGGLAPAAFPRPDPAARSSDPRAAPGPRLCRSQSGARRAPSRACAALSIGSKPASAPLPDLLHRRRRAARPGSRPRISRRPSGWRRPTSETGGERLWRDAAGEAAARFSQELIDAAEAFPPLPGRHYPALFEALAAGAVVRPLYGRHPRLAIWGLVEARLQQADLVVLGGLNEGSWPAWPRTIRGCRGRCGANSSIAVPERAIGIAAHDFAQAFAAPEVGADPRDAQRGRADRAVALAVAARRGAARGRARRCAEARSGDTGCRRATRRMRNTGRLPPAAPRPPLSARPRRLSVTQIETWLRDPYAIYARHILGLKALDELDADPGRADLGICIHEALAEFVRRFPRELPADADVGAAGDRASAFRPAAVAAREPGPSGGRASSASSAGSSHEERAHRARDRSRASASARAA